MCSRLVFGVGKGVLHTAIQCILILGIWKRGFHGSVRKRLHTAHTALQTVFCDVMCMHERKTVG